MENKTDSKLISGSKKILTVSINRDPEKGFEIALQSPLNWGFLKANDERYTNIGKVRCARAKRESLDGINGVFYADNVFESGGFPNLQLLLAQDINKGVVFNFGVFPISEDKIRKWVADFKDQVKMIYLTYCKPVNTTISFTAATIETENHQ